MGNSFVRSLGSFPTSMVVDAGPDVLNGKLIKALINLMLEIEFRNLKREIRGKWSTVWVWRFFFLFFLRKIREVKVRERGKIFFFFFVIDSFTYL